MKALIVTTLIASAAIAPTQPPGLRQFDTVVNLESDATTSAGVSAGDLDRDGDLDLVLARGRHDPVVDRVLLNDGRGRFTARDLSAAADRTYSAVLADIDGDGDLDALASNDIPDNKLIYVNDGRGSFTIAGTWGSPKWATRNAAAADLNGDGRPDVIAANRPGPSFACLNDGQGKFDACVALGDVPSTTIVPADFDRDGDVDLAVPHRGGGPSAIYINDGRASFAAAAPFATSTAARSAAAGDLNADGWPDLVVGDLPEGVLVYLNDGRGSLATELRVGEDGTGLPYSIALGDLNRDQRLDIVVGDQLGASSVLYNTGTGTKYERVTFGDGRGPVYGLAIGDLDGDGYPDIAAARSDAVNVVYFSRVRWYGASRPVTADRFPSRIRPFDPVAEIRATPIVGAWQGVVTRADGRQPSGLEVLVERLTPGEAAGRVAYFPRTGRNNCGAIITLQERRGDIYLMSEQPSAGECPGGRTQLRRLRDGRLRWEFFSSETATQPEWFAILERKRPQS